jgi:DNA adenine methylase
MRQAFGCSASVGWGYERDGTLSGGTRARSFASVVDELARFAQRMRGVQIENLDWRDMLTLYDTSGACFYLDPPYHPDTRATGKGHGYRHELTAEDHHQLLETITGMRASVLLSGYQHPSYDVLEDAGFERVELNHHITASRHPSGRRHVREVIWRRAAAGQELTQQLWAP